MKIGLVCPYNILNGGGVQEIVLALEEGLSQRGHDAKIIAPQPRNHEGTDDEKFILVGMGATANLLHTSGYLSAAFNLAELERILNEEKFDILHFHEPWIPMLSRQILARSDSINIATFHARLPDGIMRKTFESMSGPYVKAVQKRLHVLTAVSDAASEYLLSVEPDAEVKIIPNGINLKKYKADSSAKRDPDMILFIGRLEKRKGVKHLIDTFQLLQERSDRKLKLVIAGDGPERGKLEDQASKSEHGGIEFLGRVDEKTKLKLLCESSVFCSPALYGESFGIVLLEAMAMGVPTVAGNNPGYRDVMQGFGSVSLTDPEDSKKMAEKITQFLNDDKLRQEWKDWAETYVKQFDYEKIITAYENLYQESVAKFVIEKSK